MARISFPGNKDGGDSGSVLFFSVIMLFLAVMVVGVLLTSEHAGLVHLRAEYGNWLESVSSGPLVPAGKEIAGS